MINNTAVYFDVLALNVRDRLNNIKFLLQYNIKTG